MTKLMCWYDECRDSDSIMLLKVYNDWWSRWHRNISFSKNSHSRLNLKITHDERDWCKRQGLDVSILRETA